MFRVTTLVCKIKSVMFPVQVGFIIKKVNSTQLWRIYFISNGTLKNTLFICYFYYYLFSL